MALEVEVLMFEVGQQRFGVRSDNVREVLRAVALSQLPQAPSALEGVLNLRGLLVPVLDVRTLLGFEPQAMHHTDHLLVLQVGEHQMAIRVDRAVDLMRLSVDTTAKAQNRNSSLIEFIAKTSDGVVDVIDPACLLSNDDTESLIRTIGASGATEMTA